MPSVSPCGNFTSFMGDGNWGWSSDATLHDRNLSYAGTWGIGVQLRNMSFVVDLKHTFRAVCWGGTNSPAITKYAWDTWGWGSGNAEFYYGEQELYLTTNDGILELISSSSSSTPGRCTRTSRSITSWAIW